MLKKKNIYTVFFLVFVLISFNSCYLKRYTRAQKYFNEAALLDNKFKLQTNKQDEGTISFISPENQIKLKYLNALKDIKKVVKSKKNKLQRDGLLASAYTIKALSEWKTDKYGLSILTARNGLEELTKAKSSGMKATPRDEAILTAIPGLIKADRAASMVAARPDQRNYETIATTVQNGLNDIDAAIKQAPDGHPVRKYLNTVKLAMLETWLLASADLKGDAGREASQKIMKMQKEVKKIMK